MKLQTKPHRLLSSARIFTWIIQLYIWTKPLLHQINLTVFGVAPTCKYSKSCSHYTIEMIQKRGTISGLYLGWRRVLSCWQ